MNGNEGRMNLAEGGDKDRQFVTALARGLAVLRCFTPEAPELGSTEIAAMTGLPQPTVWRLCYTLQRLDILTQGRDPARLRLSYGLLSLGYATLVRGGITEVAMPGMQKIADRFGVAVSLAARDGDNMLIVARAEGPTILRLALSVGTTLPIGTSALGWAYLAGAPEAERHRILDRLREQSPADWETQYRDIASALDQYARSGFVFNLRQFHPDVNAIGVPVVSVSGRRVMALNCGGAVSVASREQLSGPIAAALRHLAVTLGPTLDGG
jgi:DNA-binding IclR family transcriptional regulator